MAKAHVLIVEDDNITVMELRERLQGFGYGVSGAAAYGEEAIEKAEETRPDVVLMDIRLKGDMDGIEAAEQIRARFDIPVVYLTAYTDEDTLQRAKVTEPYGYILKPFQERELYITIEVALYKHRAEQALRRAEAEARRRLREQTALQKAGAVITSTLDLTTVLSHIAEQMGQAVDATSAYISSYEPTTMMARVLAEYIGPRACVQEQTSDLGAACVADAEDEWFEMMCAGQPDMSHIDDPGLTESERAHMQQFGAKTILYVPLRIKDLLVGYIEVWESRRRREFTPEEIALCEGIAQQAAIALENARLYEQAQQEIAERKRAEEKIRRHLERMEALRESDKAVTSTLDLTDVLNVILEELERVIPYHSAGIFLFSDDTARLAAGKGLPDLERALQISFPVKEDPLTRELLREERPLVLADAQTNERFLARGGTEYVRSWIGVPLMVKGKPVGFLTIDHREPGVYDEESAEMAEAFASQAAIAIENARLYEEAQRELAERKRAEQLLRALNLAALAMERALTSEEIFAAVAEELKKVGFLCVVLLVDESQKRLSLDYSSYEAVAVKAAEKLLGLKAESFSVPVEHVDAWRKVLWERETIFVESGEELLRQWLPGPAKRFAKQIVSMLRVSKAIDAPLMMEDQVVGLLSVQSDDLTEDDVPAITAFAYQVAAALRKAQLMQDLERSLTEVRQAQEELQRTAEDLRRTLGATIQAMAFTVETRDPYTAGHQRRVASLARAIATEMGLSQEQIEGIRMAAAIHDIGKITVPAEILSKPGRLSDIEFGLIKMHPQAGYDILKTIAFPWPVAQMIFQHHERMDGSGYPQGLSDEEIILEARILAVADVVEAMASFRPYRPALGIDKALEEVSQNRASFHPAWK